MDRLKFVAPENEHEFTREFKERFPVALHNQCRRGCARHWYTVTAATFRLNYLH